MLDVPAAPAIEVIEDDTARRHISRLFQAEISGIAQRCVPTEAETSERGPSVLLET